MKIEHGLDYGESDEALDLIKSILKEKDCEWMSCGSLMVFYDKENNIFEVFTRKASINLTKKEIEKFKGCDSP